jgi:hypothetical protein
MRTDFPKRRNSKTPTLNTYMKAQILKLVFSRVGPLITAAISTAVGFIVVQLARIGLVLDADQELQLIATASGLIYTAINYLVNKYAGEQAKAIQEALGVVKDGWIGPVTIATAEQAKARIIAKRGRKSA